MNDARPMSSIAGGSARPLRLTLSRQRGFRLQEASRAINGLACVMVSRPTKWGNPFMGGRDGDQAQCVARFRYEAAPKLAADARRELRGKNLACWCAPGAPCHADVLVEIANSSRAAFEKWRFRLRDCGADVHKIGHYCMVHDELWAVSGLAPLGGLLCLGCLAARVGRPLRDEDFTAIVPRAWLARPAGRPTPSGSRSPRRCRRFSQNRAECVVMTIHEPPMGSPLT